MKLYFTNLPGPFEKGTRRLLKSKNCQICENGMNVTVQPGQQLQVGIANGTARIIYPRGGFFRALGLLLEHMEEDNYSITEQPKFENLGLQLDLARNGALRLDAIKKMMDYLALMGYQQLYLYLEDMFCLPEREYFGYMRGRYSAQDLKELDDYAAEYDMELIPSIEVLGHMEQYLRWDEANDVKDTARELMADSEVTYQFVESMIKTVIAPLRTRKICLNMDETHNLGLGKYLDKNGYVTKEELFCRHLNKMFEITDSLGLEGIVASDMFFRMAASDGGYYTKPAILPQKIVDKIPQNAALIYWHYGECPGCDEYMVPRHMDLNRKIIFYGSTWTWSGHLPHTEYAIRATREALPVCAQYGVPDVVQSIWGDDDGMTCSHFYSLLTLQDTAEYAYGHEDDAWLANRFRFCTGGDMDAFMAMSNYQTNFKFGEVSDDFMELFRGKMLFWHDIMMGQADEYLSKVPMSGFYGETAEKFAAYAREDSPWQKHYAYIETLFRYLSLKCEIAEILVDTYQKKDNATLSDICYVRLPKLLQLLQQCHQQHKALWLADYKPFGWEVADRQYGGSESRTSYAMERLDAYLKGSIPCLEELEEKRLPMTINPWNSIRRIASTTADF